MKCRVVSSPASDAGGRKTTTAARLVAADASPLIGLAAAGLFDVLRELFGAVVVSRAVVDEIAAGGSRPGADELAAAMRAGWVRVAPTPPATWRLEGLDAGEASTIALALEHDGPALVLMDDAIGRGQAAAHGLELMDLAGLLVAAQRAGLVEDIGSRLDALARSGFTVPERRVRAALGGASEPPDDVE